MTYTNNILALLSDLISTNSNRIEAIQCYFNNVYYDLVDESEVTFLENYKITKGLTARQKMIVYHSAIMYISIRFFNEAMLLKGIKVNDDFINELFPIYSLLEQSTYVKDFGVLLSNITIDQLEEILITSLTDYVNLLSRKKSGTEITPKNIVEFMLDNVRYTGSEITSKKILEPACGSGRYISAIIKRFIVNIEDSSSFVTLITESKSITAYDLNPLNIFVSKIVVLMNTVDYFPSIQHKDLLKIFSGLPFYTKDALRCEHSIFDFVVGNPPYIRLQNLEEETRNYIKENFESATGRFDAYVCFIEAAVNSLKPGGRFSFITSNKFLTTNYGLGIRKYLSENLSIELLLDLSDTKYFEAAVLPVIITGVKLKFPINNKVTFCQVKVDTSLNVNHSYVEDIFKHINSKIKSDSSHSGKYVINNGRNDIPVSISVMKIEIPTNGKQWNFSAENNSILKKKIESHCEHRMSDFFDICVGIKSTADTVFVKPLTEKFLSVSKLELDLIHPLIQSQNVKRWKLEWSSNNPKDRYILYPYVNKNGSTEVVDIKDYPQVMKYLNENQTVLKSRKYLTNSRTRFWYEIWVPQSFEKFNRNKIVTKDIVSHNTFAIDFDGHLCQGNTFFLYLKQQRDLFSSTSENEREILYYYLAILNSDLMEFYQKLISGSLYSKKFRYTTANLSRWPIIKFSKNSNSDKLITLVKRIIESNEKSVQLEIELNDLVFQMYGIDDREKEIIKMFLKSNS